MKPFIDKQRRHMWRFNIREIQAEIVKKAFLEQIVMDVLMSEIQVYIEP